MDFTYKVEDIRLIYAFHAFACILVDKKLCTQRCTPKSEGAANFSFYPEVLRCRDHIKLEMNQIVCWVVLYLYLPFLMGCAAMVLSLPCHGDTRPARGSKLTLLSQRVDGYHPSKNNHEFHCSLAQIKNRYPLAGLFARKLSKLFTDA